MLDVNFFEAIQIWIGRDKNLDYQSKLEDCIPLLCVHYGMSIMLKWREKKSSKVLSKN